MDEMVEYWEYPVGFHVDGSLAYDYIRLKPTGKWRICGGPYEENVLYIQHKGILFKYWVSEYDIKLMRERRCCVNG